MSHILRRWPVPLLTIALMASFAFTQDPAPALSEKELQKQVEKERKAKEQADKEEARKAEEEKKAQDKAEKDRLKNLPKHSDIENIGNRNINEGGAKLLKILPAPGMMSVEDEIVMGRQLAADVDRQARFIQDPIVTEYVNRIGQNIAHNSDAKVPFTIKVIESDEINAFALPGGFFYVNSGLLLAADDEAELAGVMAHEIAHVAARHVAKDQAKERTANVLTIPLILATGPIGFGANQAKNIFVPLGFLKFSRGAEEEADFYGLQYLYASGYDPEASVTFFEKLQARETVKPGTVSSLWSTHPLTAERIEKTKKNIKLILPPRDRYIVTTSEFQKVKDRLIALQSAPPPTVPQPEAERPPSLRRRTPGSSGQQPAESTEPAPAATRPEDRDPAPDDRPTLRRRQ